MRSTFCGLSIESLTRHGRLPIFLRPGACHKVFSGRGTCAPPGPPQPRRRARAAARRARPRGGGRARGAVELRPGQTGLRGRAGDTPRPAGRAFLRSRLRAPPTEADKRKALCAARSVPPLPSLDRRRTGGVPPGPPLGPAGAPAPGEGGRDEGPVCPPRSRRRRQPPGRAPRGPRGRAGAGPPRPLPGSGRPRPWCDPGLDGGIGTKCISFLVRMMEVIPKKELDEGPVAASEQELQGRASLPVPSVAFVAAPPRPRPPLPPPLPHRPPLPPGPAEKPPWVVSAHFSGLKACALSACSLLRGLSFHLGKRC